MSTVHELPVVQFRWSSRWCPVIVRNVSPDGIFVTSTCAPRIGDRVTLRFEQGQAMSNADVTVVHVTVGQGVAGFGGCFVDDAPSRDDLVARTLAAFRARISAGQPRPFARAHERYLVRWPVFVHVEGAWLPRTAIDLSLGGAQIEGTPPRAQSFPVAITLEDGNLPATFHARMVRATGEGSMGPARFSVAIDNPASRPAYRVILARIAARARRHVGVAGDSGHAAALRAELEDVGYRVTPVSVHQPDEHVGIDLLVLADSLSKGDRAALVARVMPELSPRVVPGHDHQPADARRLVDRALLG